MKKFKTKFTLFFLGALLIHVASSILAWRAGDVFKQGAFKVCERKRDWAREKDHPFNKKKKSVVFFGNSVLLAGIRPDSFDAPFNGQVESFNFALPALPVAPAYFVLQDLIKNWGAPDFIVIHLVTDTGRETGLFDFNAVQGMGFPREFFSYLVNRENKVALLNYLFPIRLYTHEVVRYLKASLLHPAEITAEKEKTGQILSQLVKDRGYYFINEQALFSDERLPEGFEILPPAERTPIHPDPRFDLDEDPYVRKFFDLAKKEGINVLLLGPHYREKSQPDMLSPPGYITVIPQHYPNVTVTDESWKITFLPNRFFSDKTHLNPEGADRYSRRVADLFRDAFGNNLKG